MKNKRVRELVFCAVLIALMFTFAWTPIGMIPVGPVSATTIFIPVLIGIIILDDWKYSFILGISFGLISLIRALVAPTEFDAFFQNPIVSVLPRFIMTVLCHYLYQLIKKMKNETLKFAIIGGLVPLFNTIFTISSLSLVYYNDITKLLIESKLSWVKWLFALIALTNMLPEIILGIIIAIPVGKISKTLVSQHS